MRTAQVHLIIKMHNYFQSLIAYADRRSIALLILLPILSLVYSRVFQANYDTGTVIDMVIWAYDPSSDFPLLWVLCPIVTMFILMQIWNSKKSYNYVVRQKSSKKIGVLYLCDALVVSTVSSVIIHFSLLLFGFVFLGEAENFDAQTSMFFFYSGGETLENFSFISSLLITYLYCLLSLVFSNFLFLLIHSAINRPSIAFSSVVLLGLPMIHGSTSFIYDFFRNILGGSLDLRNPLSYIYDTSGIFYGTWLPESSHNFWFLFTLIGLCIPFIVFMQNKKEWF